MNVSYPRTNRAQSVDRALVPLAITGIGCRIPGGADDAESFWSFMCEGRSGVSEIPEDRWIRDLFYDPDPETPRKGYTKWGGFVNDVTGFDADFFNISPREAEFMDPQQRMLLHVIWEALEDAGVAPSSLAGSRTGVFVGASLTDYSLYLRTKKAEGEFHAGTGIALSVISNRVSHRLDLKGPSLTVDTACSSSLTATHLGCRSIWDGESDMVIAGGVSVMLDPSTFVTFSKANMMSPTGTCHTFDAAADGYVRAEGSGVVIIKPLDQALADNDRIYAVIRATAVNQDGQTSTITVPSADAQADVLHEALDRAGLAPADVGYFEAHGTGTPVGDPIEAAAIGSVFADGRASDEPLFVGSIKSVVGHQEPAAGIVGLIKAALCVHHGAIPPNLNFSNPSPYIPFDELRIRVPTDVQSWPSWTPRRVAAVNSFGFGGTNACALVEEPPAVTSVPSDQPEEERRWVVPLSAASEEALKTSAKDLAAYLRNSDDAGADLRDVAATLGQRRAHLPERVAVIAENAPELADRLTDFARAKPRKKADKDAAPTHVSGRRLADPKVAFVFAGQGGQWWGMAQHLLKHDPVFRAEVEAFEAAFKKVSGLSVIEELTRDEATSRVDDLFFAQPCLFALQAGLVARWRAWGVEPDLVIGHSFGEVCTSYCSGALSLEQAARVVYFRAKSTEMVRGRGGIATLALSAEEARQTLAELGEKEVDIAGINSSSMINLAGHTEPLQHVLDHLIAKDPDLFYRVLKVEFPPHCFVQDEIKEYMLDALQDLEPVNPKVPVYSTVTGRLLGDTPFDNSYWFRNQRQTVQFKQALDNALEDGANIFIEIGPHATLSGLIAGNAMEAGKTVVATPSLHRKQQDSEALSAALATAHCAGADVDWSAVTAKTYNPVKLPRYPWEMKRFWLESPEAEELLFSEPVHPLLGEPLLSAAPVWECDIDVHSFPYLKDHQVNGATVFPGTGYLELMFAVAKEVLGDGPVELQDVSYVEALILNEGQAETVQTTYDPDRRLVRIYSRPAGDRGEWTLRASGSIVPLAAPGQSITLDWTPGDDMLSVGKARLYKRADQVGLNYGTAFQGMRKLWVDGSAYTGELSAPAAVKKALGLYRFHPALFDACMHLGFGATFQADIATRDAPGMTFMPTGIERVQLYRSPGAKLVARTAAFDFGDDGGSMDADIFDADGQLAVRFQGMTSKPVGGAEKEDKEGAQLGYYQETWEQVSMAEDTADMPVSTWLLFDDGGPVSNAIADALESRGREVNRIAPGADASEDGNTITIRPAEGADYEALLASMSPDEQFGIIHLWSLRPAEHQTPPTGEDLMAAQELGAYSMMHLAQALAARDDLSVRLISVTSAAAVIDEIDTAPDPYRLSHAAMNGFARTVASELDHIEASSIDLDPDGSGEALELAIEEILHDTRESDVALRKDQRFVRRVMALPEDEMAPRLVPAHGADGDQPYQVTMNAPGVLDNLKIVEADAQQPEAGQVAVRVAAVGLNFRDVMAATGLLPPGAESGNSWEALGLECAGDVTAVGDGVTHVKPGDRVMASARGCLRAEVLTAADGVHKIPTGVDYNGAATIGSVFMTAYYSLVTLGRLRKGERVLIHTATGGVGLAAVQIAQMIGAEIFATAGSPKKRAYLKKLGIKHIMDSRSLAFADEIMEATNGEGVDVVLNALAGPAIEKGISVLAPFGRFLEIGKRDIYDNSPIGLKALRKNITFHVIDLANVTANRAGDIAGVFDELLALFEEKKLEPLPAEVFPVSKIADAFRHMSRARHIGKVVVSLEEPDLMVERTSAAPLRLRADGAYLITGGARGFGLAIAGWMAEHGAGHLYLVSRSGPSTKTAEKAIDAIRATGTSVTIVKADISSSADVDRVIAEIDAGPHQLRGIIHGAMVLDDAFITQLDTERMARVLRPKVMGAWNLHCATLEHSLDFFMSMSSLAAIFGSRGQGNYVAANSYLDVFSQYRGALGLAGQTVNWGALGGVGAVARSKQLQRYMESMGMPAVPLDDSLNAIGVLTRKDVANAAFFMVDWPLLLRTNADLANSTRFAPIVENIAQGAGGGGKARSEIMAVAGTARAALLTRYLSEQVAGVLRTDADKLDPERPLSEMGLDSLTSFELKNRIEGDLAIDLPVAKFLQKPTISGLCEAVLGRLETEGASGDEQSGGDVQEFQPTEQQRVFWNIWKNDPAAAGTLAYLHVGFALSIRPRLDRQRLGNAFQKLVDGQPTLRMRFPEVDGEIRGHIDQAHPTGLVVEDATGLSDTEFQTLLNERQAAVIDLEAGPLFQIHVFERPDDTDVILFRISHLICDSWTNQMIVSSLFSGYLGIDLGPQAEDGAIVEFPDFARWEVEHLAAPETHEQMRKLVESYAGAGPTVRLPASRPRHTGAPRAGGSIPFEIDKRTTAEIGTLSKLRGATPFAVMMSAFAAHLHATTGDADVPIWSAAANRSRRRFQHTMGWLANMVMVREPIAGADSFDTVIEKISNGLQAALSHEDIPYYAALRTAAEDGNAAAADLVSRGAITSRLHQFSFSMYRADSGDELGLGALLHEPNKRIEFGGIEARSMPLRNPVSLTDVGAVVQQHDGKWFGEIRFDSENYDAEVMVEFARGFVDGVGRLVGSPEAAIERSLGEVVQTLAPVAE